jgi:hypothetical protein
MKKIRERQETEMPTAELIAKMERNAAVLLKTYGPTEARRQMENVLKQWELMADYHSGYAEAILAMGAKLDELIDG